MTHDGRCPACDAEGAVGAACPSAECVGKDLHFIPSEYAKKLRLRGVVFRDPNLGRSVGDFLLVDILGRGTYGRVYLALQAPLWMKAALKLLTYDHDDPEVKRDVRSKFEREAVSLSKLAHPNIVRLIKYGFWAEQPFLVMEYVDRARTLKLELDEQIRRGGGFSFKVVDRVINQLLNGLDCAHEQQIIHRDIKPDNILLQNVTGDATFIRIVDFGLAKFTEQTRNTAYVLGTPAYMAPEQVNKTNIGPWTDLYAVGAITLEMMIGHRLFSGGSAHDVLMRKSDPSFDPLADVQNLELPGRTLAFFRKALAFEPRDRHQSVAAFRDEMREVFGSLSRLEQKSIVLDDLMKVLGSRERDRLEQERQRLDQERAEFERQRQWIEREKRSLEQLRERLSVELGPEQLAALSAEPEPQPDTPLPAPGTEPSTDWASFNSSPDRSVAPPARLRGRARSWAIGLGLLLIVATGAAVTVWLVDRDRSSPTPSPPRSDRGPTIGVHSKRPGAPPEKPGKGQLRTPKPRPKEPMPKLEIIPSPRRQPTPPNLLIPKPRPTVRPRDPGIPTPKPTPKPTTPPKPIAPPKPITPPSRSNVPRLSSCRAACDYWGGCLRRVGTYKGRVSMMTDGCVRQCEYYQSNTNFSLATVAKSLFRYCELFAPEKGPAPYDESKLTCDGLCDEMATCYRARGIPMTRAMLKSTCEASCKQLVQRTVIGFFKITVESACASLKQVKMP